MTREEFNALPNNARLFPEEGNTQGIRNSSFCEYLEHGIPKKDIELYGYDVVEFYNWAYDLKLLKTKELQNIKDYNKFCLKICQPQK